jgi:hypothetical protein
VRPAHTGVRERNAYTTDFLMRGMNFRLALAGVCLLLASSGLFAASGTPAELSLFLAAVAGLGATVAVARFGFGHRAA